MAGVKDFQSVASNSTRKQGFIELLQYVSTLVGNNLMNHIGAKSAMFQFASVDILSFGVMEQNYIICSQIFVSDSIISIKIFLAFRTFSLKV